MVLELGLVIVRVGIRIYKRVGVGELAVRTVVVESKVVFRLRVGFSVGTLELVL